MSFGEDLFGEEKQHKLLPPAVRQRVKRAYNSNAPIDVATADSFALALSHWAQERGATQWRHWSLTSHNTLLDLHSPIGNSEDGADKGQLRGESLLFRECDMSNVTTGLLQPPPDAGAVLSWLPSGMPPFILRQGPEKPVLCIPSILVSKSSQAGLDAKTAAVRGMEGVEESVVELMEAIARPLPGRPVQLVDFSVDFVVVDAKVAAERADLVQTGRLLFDSSIAIERLNRTECLPSRTQGFASEAEARLARLGIAASVQKLPEVMGQWRLAVSQSTAREATDYASIAPQVLEETAKECGLMLLWGPKPMDSVGVNRSSLSWSIREGQGRDLLECLDGDEMTMGSYLLIVAAIIRSTDLHGSLLRAVSTQSGTSLQSSTPKFVSLFLGEPLTKLCTACMDGSTMELPLPTEPLEIGLQALPEVPSPEVELNTVGMLSLRGGRLSIWWAGTSTPGATLCHVMEMWGTMLNESLSYITKEIEASCRAERNPTVVKRTVLATVQKVLKQHIRIVFNGDTRTEEFKNEAVRRGVNPVRGRMVDVVAEMTSQRSLALLTRSAHCTERLVRARVDMSQREIVRSILVEARCMCKMFYTHIVPAVMRFQSQIAGTIISIKAALNSHVAPKSSQDLLSSLAVELQEATEACDTLGQLASDAQTKSDNVSSSAEITETDVRGFMTKLAEHCTKLEGTTDATLWPLPGPIELLTPK